MKPTSCTRSTDGVGDVEAVAVDVGEGYGMEDCDGDGRGVRLVVGRGGEGEVPYEAGVGVDDLLGDLVGGLMSSGM